MIETHEDPVSVSAAVCKHRDPSPATLVAGLVGDEGESFAHRVAEGHARDHPGHRVRVETVTSRCSVLVEYTPEQLARVAAELGAGLDEAQRRAR